MSKNKSRFQVEKIVECPLAISKQDLYNGNVNENYMSDSRETSSISGSASSLDECTNGYNLKRSLSHESHITEYPWSDNSHKTITNILKPRTNFLSDTIHKTFSFPLKPIKTSNQMNSEPPPDIEIEALNYYPNKKISTFDTLPNLEHYKNIFSLNKGRSRPSLTELHEVIELPPEYKENIMIEKPYCPSKLEKVRGLSQGPKFGWIQGVLLRCILNIWGVMLFLRLSWIVGQAGIGFATLIVILSVVVTSITSMSMSAICTNGEVKGGGAYYMISRSLGPEFGGAIGVIFSIASNVAVSMNVVGLAETVVDLISKHASHLFDVISPENWIRIVGCITAVLLLVIVRAGMEWESKAQVIFLIFLIVAFLSYFLGTVLPIPQSKRAKGLLGYQSSLLKENFLPDFQKGASFFSIFAIYFPSATGILAGANISGDLKDAQKSIPKGTFTAILITAISYIFMIWTFGSVMLREASGNITDLYYQSSNGTLNSNSLGSTQPLTINQLTGSHSPLRSCAARDTCKFGLLNDYQAAEMISSVGPLITIGIFSATLSSALACLVGASKVFQALCRDKIFPSLEGLAKGSKKNDEPFRLYILAFFISVLFILIGDLNIIAPIISNFYLMAYALINYSCFDASLSNSLGFRPGFKYFNPWISLLGGLLCVVSMFLIKWWATLITFIFICSLYCYIRYKKPDINWGSSTQAHVYKDALTFLYKLNQTEEHVKNFRPQILALTGDPRTRPVFLDFVSLFTKNLSLLICGHIIKTDPKDSLYNYNVPYIYSYLEGRRVRAIYNTVMSTDLRQGARALLQLSGLGRLRPNVLLMGYLNWQRLPIETIVDYFNIIHDTFDLKLSIGILRMPFGLSARVTNIYDINNLNEKSSPTTFHNASANSSPSDLNGDGKIDSIKSNTNKPSVAFHINPDNLTPRDRPPFFNGIINMGHESFLIPACSPSDSSPIDLDLLDDNKNSQPDKKASRENPNPFPFVDLQKSQKFGKHKPIKSILKGFRRPPTKTTGRPKLKSLSSPRDNSCPNFSHQTLQNGAINESYSDIGEKHESCLNSIDINNNQITYSTSTQDASGSANKNLNLKFFASEPSLIQPPGRGGLRRASNLLKNAAASALKTSSSRMNTVKEGIDIKLITKRKRSKKLSRVLTQYYSSKRYSLAAGLGNLSEDEKTDLEDYYLNYFTIRQRKGTIDVWWLYDDGGLTILLPYIISQRRNWQKCKVRFFALSTERKELDLIHHSFVAMLNKFRIDFSDVIIIPDITKLPYPLTHSRFDRILEPFRVKDTCDPKYKEGMVTDAEYEAMIQRSYRHMRLHELLQKHSLDANLIVITLPIPRKGTCSAALYMTWLEMISQNLPPILMVRGNQQSVLTFYS